MGSGSEKVGRTYVAVEAACTCYVSKGDAKTGGPLFQPMIRVIVAVAFRPEGMVPVMRML